VLIASGDIADVNHREADLPQFVQDFVNENRPQMSEMKSALALAANFFQQFDLDLLNLEQTVVLLPQ
jgi:hypothetical protein